MHKLAELVLVCSLVAPLVAPLCGAAVIGGSSEDTTDLSFTDLDEPTEPPRSGEAEEGTLDVDVKQITAADLQTLLENLGIEQKVMSVSQIFFYNAVALGIFWLISVILGGIIKVFNLLRTPLLVYKEVNSYPAPHPAPKMPEPHPQYGYEGGYSGVKASDVIPHPAPAAKPVIAKKHESSYSSYA